MDGAGRDPDAAAHHGDGGKSTGDHHPQRQPRRRLRPLDQSLPGLRTRLHLLLRPPRPRLYGPLARPRFRKQAVLQTGSGGAAGEGTGQAHLHARRHPHQPVERRLRVTRQVLEVLSRFRHPFSIITKSALIERDLDILGPMGEAGLARAAVSITTVDRKLARAMEPRAATPERRLSAVRSLAAAGVPTVVMFAPVIPGLNDHELEAVLQRAAEAGALQH